MMSSAPYTMCSAVDFFPSTMRMLQNLAIIRSPYLGSGRMRRLGTSRRRGIWCYLSSSGSLLGPLHAVLRPTLRPVRLVGVRRAGRAGRVERATHHVVAHAGEVLDAAAADEHDAVLLQVVALAGDVGRDLDAVRETDARDLAERRVRLLRGRGVHAHADAALLRAVLQRRGGRLGSDLL